MIRQIILFMLLCLARTASSQSIFPNSLNVSYFGEMITHAGIKISATYKLRGWEKKKQKRSGKEKRIQKVLELSPGLGFFYHKHYQSTAFILPELSLSRKNKRGGFICYGFGVGYMRTFIPDVYELDASGEIKKVYAGYNYFISNYSLAFGKELKINLKTPLTIYIKPQCIHAWPNTPNGLWYFALEIGISCRLK